MTQIIISSGTTNRGFADANCRAFLQDLSKDGLKEPILKNANMLLWAQNGGDPDFSQGFLLRPGTFGYFNLAYVAPGLSSMQIPSNEWNVTQASVLESGNYHFQVEIKGKGCGPAHAQVAIRYGGDTDIEVIQDH